MSEDDRPEIDAHEAARSLGAGVVLIDVREPDEYAEVHATGARLLPLSDLTNRADEVPRDQPILLICRSAARSANAARWLNDRGASATNVAGGTLAWVEAGLPTSTGPLA